jgi:serine/threonine-protein kinase
MGVVVEATHLQLAQRVAIKFLLPELCGQRDAVTRFLREARAAVQIESEHVSRVTDVGTSDEGVPFLVMELLEGVDLAQLLQQERQLPVAQAVSLILQAADAIAEAHSLGIIHRDLKPSNLFLATRRDGSRILKVLDFGISKAVAEVAAASGTPARTATATVMGSPHYMSPEQVRSSRSVDPRADIWSLGVILHELLAGEPPFKAETLPGVLASIVADPPTPLRAQRPDVPSALDAIVARCLQKDRQLRFASVPELARALVPFAPNEALPALLRIQSFEKPMAATQAIGPIPSLAVPAPEPAQVPMPSPPPPLDTQRGFAHALGPNQERKVGLAAAGLVAVLCVVFGYLGYRSPPPAANAPSSQGAASSSAEASASASANAAAISGQPLIDDEPLTAQRWDNLELVRAGGAKPTTATGSLTDERLFVDRQ